MLGLMTQAGGLPTWVYFLVLAFAIAAILTGIVVYVIRMNRRLDRALIESRRTGEALKLSEERHRLLAENATDVIWTMDLDGRFTYISPSVQRLRGFTPDEVLQESLDQTMTPGSAALAHQALGQLLGSISAGEGTFQYRGELEQRCKGGATVWTEVTATAIRNARGEFVGIVGVTRDIGERRRLEAMEKFRTRVLELQATGAPLQDTLSAIARGAERLEPAMLCSIMVLDSSQQWLLVGAAPSLPDDYSRAIDGICIGPRAGICGVAAFSGERVIVDDIQDHDGWGMFREAASRAGLAACWSEPIRSSAGEVLGIFAVYHRHPHVPDAAEIGLIEWCAPLAGIALERHRNAEALRESEERLKFVIEGSQVGFWDWNIRTGLIKRNKVWADSLGGSAEDVLATEQQWLDPVHPDDLSAVRQSIGDHLAGRTPLHEATYRIRARDGSYRWFLDRGKVVQRDAGGQAVRMSGTHTDVTAYKQLESELREIATRDFLTGLSNRRAFIERLEGEVARGQRLPGPPVAVMMLDVDHFKRINDTFGHEAGDLALKHLAGLMVDESRKIDMVARLGGEEFAILLPGADIDAATAFAERLRVRVACTPLVRHAQEIPMTISLGITALAAVDRSPDEVLIRADEALYSAKLAGRNRAFAVPPGARPDDGSRSPAVDPMRLIWRKAYESGLEPIDKQHRELFESANGILAAVSAGTPKPQVGEMIQALLERVSDHFQTEEAVLAAAGYPLAPAHLVMHSQMVNRARSLMSQFSEGCLDVRELVQFILQEVVDNHLISADRDLLPLSKPRPRVAP